MSRKAKTDSQTGAEKRVKNDSQSYRVEDVMELLGVSKSMGYKLIGAMRRDLIKEGKIPDYYPVGRVPKKEFNRRMMIDD